MKRIKYIVILILLSSCTSNIEYTYKLTYTDGTEETIITRGLLKTESGSDCIKTCGCGSISSKKYCGVRKFVLISERDIDTKRKTKSYIPDNF